MRDGAPPSLVSPAELLAERAANVCFANISDAVISRAKQCIADAIALGLHGTGQPAVEILARTVDGFGGHPQSSAFGQPRMLPTHAAALINGAAIHAIDYDDTFGPGLCHLTAAVLPAALAIAEWKGAQGIDLITAYVAGYDAAALVALASDAEATARRGFHPTGCFGTYGAAVAAGHLLGLDRAGMARAIGLAATQAAGLMANLGTMAKPLHAGKAAANGLLAALLARDGFTSLVDPFAQDSGALSYSGTLHLEILQCAPEIGAALLDTTLKPYPSCWLTHGAIDAARAVHISIAELDEIIGIEVDVAPYTARVCGRPNPASALDAKFSLQHVVALALANGNVVLDDFERLGHGGSAPTLRGKVTVNVVPDLADNAACIRVHCSRGVVHASHEVTARGSPARPLAEEDLRCKVQDLLEARGLEAISDRLLTSVDGLASTSSLAALASVVRSHPGMRAHAIRRSHKEIHRATQGG